MSFDDIETDALTTSVGLLDALIDAAAAALPGINAAPYAHDLRALGDGAARAAADLASVNGRRRRSVGHAA